MPQETEPIVDEIGTHIVEAAKGITGDIVQNHGVIRPTHVAKMVELTEESIGQSSDEAREDIIAWLGIEDDDWSMEIEQDSIATSFLAIVGKRYRKNIEEGDN